MLAKINQCQDLYLLIYFKKKVKIQILNIYNLNANGQKNSRLVAVGKGNDDIVIITELQIFTIHICQNNHEICLV